ncbi:MAG: sulfotransferase family 2 domain-containing protein [Bacteroidota bacterium]
MLVYSHMMKTAGTSLSKALIRVYGQNMHIISGGLEMNDFFDDQNALIQLEEKHPFALNCVVSHKIRPHINFKTGKHPQQWITFLREPQKRFISHYFYIKKHTHDFDYPRWKSVMNDKSIAEWSRVGDFSNYQTKFIAGEANYDKAVEILERKFAFIGLTESLDDYIRLLNKELSSLPQTISPYSKVLNQAKDNDDSQRLVRLEKEKVTAEFSDLIAAHNEVDSRLYEYVTARLAGKLTTGNGTATDEPTNMQAFNAWLNEMLFFTTRSTFHRSSTVNLSNLKRFYKRWF